MKLLRRVDYIFDADGIILRCVHRYIALSASYIIITIKDKGYSLTCVYLIADGRSRQYIARWPRNDINVQYFTTDNTNYTTITIRLPDSILQASITRYWTPRRHLHIIYTTPQTATCLSINSLMKHTIIRKYYSTQMNKSFTLN